MIIRHSWFVAFRWSSVFTSVHEELNRMSVVMYSGKGACGLCCFLANFMTYARYYTVGKGRQSDKMNYVQYYCYTLLPEYRANSTNFTADYHELKQVLFTLKNYCVLCTMKFKWFAKNTAPVVYSASATPECDCLPTLSINQRHVFEMPARQRQCRNLTAIRLF